MPNQATYWFFNLLLCGLTSSEIYYRIRRSQRGGMVLGLLFFGLIWAIALPQSRVTVKSEWFRLSAVIVLMLSLTCTGEILWGEFRFKLILMVILITMGWLNAWAQGQVLHLPATFWLWVSLGAVIATFGLGQGYVDMGAYLGAWLWVISGLRLKKAEG